MAKEFPGWLPIASAAEQYGLSYEALRRLVGQGVFTRGRFTSEKEQAPIYLRVDELEAWKSEGIVGVRRIRTPSNRTTADPVPAHDLGESGD